jgi:hypothetical protein
MPRYLTMSSTWNYQTLKKELALDLMSALYNKTAEKY